MFVRKKTIKGKPHFYLVENTRQDGKVKQKVLAYLGDMDTIAGAIAQRERWIESLNRLIEKRTHKIQEMEHSRAGKPYPKPERRSHSGVYQYWNTVNDVDKYKQRIYETETQIDKLRLYL